LGKKSQKGGEVQTTRDVRGTPTMHGPPFPKKTKMLPKMAHARQTQNGGGERAKRKVQPTKKKTLNENAPLGSPVGTSRKWWGGGPPGRFQKNKKNQKKKILDERTGRRALKVVLIVLCPTGGSPPPPHLGNWLTGRTP